MWTTVSSQSSPRPRRVRVHLAEAVASATRQRTLRRGSELCDEAANSATRQRTLRGGGALSDDPVRSRPSAADLYPDPTRGVASRRPTSGAVAAGVVATRRGGHSWPQVPNCVAVLATSGGNGGDRGSERRGPRADPTRPDHHPQRRGLREVRLRPLHRRRPRGAAGRRGQDLSDRPRPPRGRGADQADAVRVPERRPDRHPLGVRPRCGRRAQLHRPGQPGRAADRVHGSDHAGGRRVRPARRRVRLRADHRLRGRPGHAGLHQVEQRRHGPARRPRPDQHAGDRRRAQATGSGSSATRGCRTSTSSR